MKTLPAYFLYVFTALLLITGCSQPSSTTVTKAGQVPNAGLLIEFNKYGLRDLTESQDFREIICQSWDNKEDFEDSKFQPSSTLEVVSRGYVFFSDGSVVKNPRGDFLTGTWVLNDAKKPFTISMNFKKAASEKYPVAKLKPFELTLKQGEGNSIALTDYVSAGLNYKDERMDPFYPANNSWRQAPGAPENDALIKSRLKACIHFFVRFYEHSINAKSETVNFAGLPTCFRWYAGGIFLYKPKDIPQNWINCFYNRDQALKAYRMADELLSKKYSWPKGESNWVKQNFFVLKQMEANL